MRELKILADNNYAVDRIPLFKSRELENMCRKKPDIKIGLLLNSIARQIQK
jgi:hypothetical protein